MSALFPTYNRWNISIESAEGTTVIDQNGKKYLDFISGIAVCNLGHRHPAVQKALEEQLNKVWHVSNLFQIDLQEEVAAQLTEKSSGDYVFFCNSGAEANEAAIKIARKYTGKSKIITFKQSFHGRTFATMSATGQEKIQQGYGDLLPTFEYVPYNDAAALEQAVDENTAAVMLEVIQGEGGVNPGTASFLEKVQSLCKQHKLLLIVDEIQTGIGRTGKPFAYQHFALDPDIITAAKGLGNGFPVGAMIGKEHLKDTFSPGSHGTTFGGNMLAMAAAKATLSEIFNDSFLQEVEEKGNYLLKQLQEKLASCPLVEEVRGKGLMVGISCKEDVVSLISTFQEKGLLIVIAGPKVLRLLPPLTVTKEELDQAASILVEEILLKNKKGLATS
ncbi:acetylornithine transaminase [Bacillus taeanensis]|uniref:Acetylornithine aminotransferase n=1 Tax=Bacillus taeanensis TaxID=273032 RepID=A0A366Y3R9_9BACI|nr:acetylornithine transaminase [Bacillus taeanensis]RBW71053.1 acetylornithine transaminase [Bacillus taeanensis]